MATREAMLVAMCLFAAVPAIRVSDLPGLPTWLADEPKSVREKLEENVEKRLKKPLMQGIHVMRMNLCWARPDLISHDECMKYMVNRCSKETTGQGLCEKLDIYVVKMCSEGREEAKPFAADLGLPCVKKGEELKEEESKVDAELDSDGDGHPDVHDAFPDDPKEWEDKNGNGIGDNQENEAAGNVTSPAPAPAAAPAAAPASAPPPVTDLDKKIRPLPKDGYNEYGGDVMHEDGDTLIADWRAEHPMTDETHDESYTRICKDNPNLDWCKLYLKANEHSAPKASGWEDMFR